MASATESPGPLKGEPLDVFPKEVHLPRTLPAAPDDLHGVSGSLILREKNTTIKEKSSLRNLYYCTFPIHDEIQKEQSCHGVKY